MDNYQIDKSKDTLFRGEFEVVKELIAAYEDGEASKRECDKVIDKNYTQENGKDSKEEDKNIKGIQDHFDKKLSNMVN